MQLSISVMMMMMMTMVTLQKRWIPCAACAWWATRVQRLSPVATLSAGSAAGKYARAWDLALFATILYITYSTFTKIYVSFPHSPGGEMEDIQAIRGFG
jgi:hypothetical protein